MAPDDILLYWKDAAQDDWETAEALVSAKKYHHALFFCHLALEKLLKGLVYAKTDQHPLPIHDLVRLAEQSTISVDETQQEQLKEITSWNLKARYDDYKQRFYHKATESFTTEWMGFAKEMFIWLYKQY